MSTINIVLIAIGVLVVASLVYVIFRQQRTIKDLQQPKYGFLGKPLAGLVTILMIGGLIGGVYLNTRPAGELDPTASADQVSFEVRAECEPVTTRNYNYIINVGFADNIDIDLPSSSNIQVSVVFDARKPNVQTLIRNSTLEQMNSEGLDIEANLESGTHTLFISAAVIGSEDSGDIEVQQLRGTFEDTFEVSRAVCIQ